MGSLNVTCAKEDTRVTLERKIALQKLAIRIPINDFAVHTTVIRKHRSAFAVVADVAG